MRLPSVMDICVGLVGRKSENVKKPLVLQAFLKGQEGHELPRKINTPVSRAVWEGEGGG